VSKDKSANVVSGGSAAGIWFAGFVGAIIYYLHFHSGSLWLVILAFLKAIIWPTLLVYHFMVFLRM
jgi:hypothetical protein